MSGFKLVHEGEHHYTLMHPDGHEAKIAKRGLSNKLHEKIKSMSEGGEIQIPGSDEEKKKVQDSFNSAFGVSKPKSSKQASNTQPVQQFAEGGAVKDPTEGLLADNSVLPQNYTQAQLPQSEISQPQQLVEPSGWDMIKKAGSYVGDKASQVYNAVDSSQLGHSLLTGTVNNTPQQQTAEQQPQATNASFQGQQQQKPQFENVSLGNTPTQPQQNNGMQMPTQGGGDQFDPFKLNKQLVGAYDQEAHQQQKITNDFQTNFNNLNAEQDKIKQDIANNHIDPARMFHDMGVGQKFVTGLALVMGGLGGGMQGKGNTVLDSLNKMIDRDVDAQKSNLGKSTTLLESNLRQYGNLNSAMAATRLGYLSAAEAQIGKISAVQNNPIAQERSSLVQAQIQMAKTQEMMKLAAQMTNQSGKGFDSAATSIRFMVPKEQQAEAYKELTRVTALKRSGQDALNSFDMLSKMAFNGALSPNLKDAKIERISTELARDEAGRVNEPERDAYKKQLGKWNDFSQNTMASKRNDILGIINHKTYSGLLSGYFIPNAPISSAKPLTAGPGFKQAGINQPVNKNNVLPVGMK